MKSYDDSEVPALLSSDGLNSDTKSISESLSFVIYAKSFLLELVIFSLPWLYTGVTDKYKLNYVHQRACHKYKDRQRRIKKEESMSGSS
jgi:hypothetical protein